MTEVDVVSLKRLVLVLPGRHASGSEQPPVDQRRIRPRQVGERLQGSTHLSIIFFHPIYSRQADLLTWLKLLT